MRSVTDAKPDWRAAKKAATRREIQRQALRLFRERGFAATTVEQIAAAAGVSHMTFFRYFPTKEDVVLADEHDDAIRTLIEQTPATLPPVQRIADALREGLAAVYAGERDELLIRNQLIVANPTLRARLWEQQATVQQLFLDALTSPDDDQATRFRTTVVAAACQAAATTAVLAWAEADGEPELPELLDQAFAALRELSETSISSDQKTR
jgi:AcrR family transcriptional regulator